MYKKSLPIVVSIVLPLVAGHRRRFLRRCSDPWLIVDILFQEDRWITTCITATPRVGTLLLALKPLHPNFPFFSFFFSFPLPFRNINARFNLSSLLNIDTRRYVQLYIPCAPVSKNCRCNFANEEFARQMGRSLNTRQTKVCKISTSRKRVRVRRRWKTSRFVESRRISDETPLREAE